MALVAAAITGAGLLTQDATLDDSIEHKIWIQGADLCRAEEDIFKGMEGKGEDSLIQTELTTKNGNGMKAIYPLVAEFGNSPKQGGDRFSNVEDFDDLEIGSDSVSCDYHRFATSSDDRSEEVLGMRGQLESKFNMLQGRQMGKWQCHHALMTILHKVNAENVVNPKGVTDQDNILSTDTLDMENIRRLKAMMAPLGGMPWRQSTDANGNEVRSYMLIATVNATFGLNSDPDYKESLRLGQTQGNSNPLWAGGFPRVDGNIIREWNPIDQPGAVKVGSPLNPHAFIGDAIAAATTADDITFGRNAANADKTGKPYAADFPLYAFPFQKGDTLSWATVKGWRLTADDTFFVVVVNPPSAAVDPDKWCLYEIDANNGNKLTMAKRLAAATSGVAYTTLGNVTWDADVNTEVFAEGALCYLATSYGTPLGASPFLGAAGLRRAWGKYKMALAYNNTIEGGFIKEQFTMSVFGHAPRKDFSGRVPGISVLRHAISYEGWNHPAPTSL